MYPPKLQLTAILRYLKCGKKPAVNYSFGVSETYPPKLQLTAVLNCRKLQFFVFLT